MNRCEIVNKYLNFAIIEAEIENAKKNNLSFSIIKFKYEVDLDNTYFFKDFIGEIYEVLNFPPILYDNKNNFIAICKNYKLHKSIAIFRKLQQELKDKYNIYIDRVGITELDKKDNLTDILERVDKYLIVSKRLSVGKIIYGLRSFDFYNISNREDGLKTVLKENANIQIYNIHKGIPIKERGTVIEYKDNTIVLKTTYEELRYLNKYEEFLYLKHKNFPNIIKGEIDKFNFSEKIVFIKNLEFQDESIIDRESTRVRPDRSIRLMVEYQNHIIADGIISSISTNSISVKMKKQNLDKIKKIKNYEFVLKFNLFVKNSISINSITIKAKVFNITDTEIIFVITPNAFIETKIQGYIKSIQKQILQTIKISLK